MSATGVRRLHAMVLLDEETRSQAEPAGLCRVAPSRVKWHLAP
jgi:hypothetical protein